MIKIWDHQPIKQLYEDGFSAQEIKDTLGLKVSVRQIQRIVKKLGISRSIGDAFRNAVKRNRISFAYKKNKIKRKKLSPKLRYKILQRDGFKCVKCKSVQTLEVDHINEDKNDEREENLQTLCHDCNQGKSLLHKTSVSMPVPSAHNFLEEPKKAIPFKPRGEMKPEDYI